MINFEIINVDNIDEKEFNDFRDKLIFQTKEWIGFIMETQKVTPIILRMSENDQLIGYFTGALFKKFGIKIIGSPFRGWTTLYMGMNLKEGIAYERSYIAKLVWKFLKKKYHCVYFEMIDRFITKEEAKKNKLRFEFQGTYIKDLSGTEEELLASFNKHCRKYIRNFEKSEVKVIFEEPNDDFANLYYSQLEKVFGYQKLTPSYDLKRVKCLLAALKEKDYVVCIKAVTPEGECVGTTMGFGFNGRGYTWGSTNIRGEKDYKQSQGLRWEMMKHWRSKQCYDYDFVGIREYKLQFNPTEIQVPRIIFTSFVPLIWLRNLAQKCYWALNSLKSKLKKKEK